MEQEPDFIPLEFTRLEADEQRRRALEFFEIMRTRRTVRAFSADPVPLEILRLAIRTAGSAPSGAHIQPWRFVVVRSPEIKRLIREAAEREERENYGRRFPDEWLEALAPFGTDEQKEFLETAPCLIVVFRIDYGLNRTQEGTVQKVKHYYVGESVGIAVGLLLAALHNAGVATLTHTPSPMGFLSRILERPPNEKPYLLIPVGYPAPEARVPNILRKPLEEIMLVVD
ncbi:MAG: nitroreductase family protein [Acidobacteria bacterium]|nr:nitroreductase family protein [Acidobacteriota bacterium]